MALLIGIDEAGYGPLLGPLVVSATVWRVKDPVDGDAVRLVDLWKALRKCVCTAARNSSARLVVGDSKEVYDRKKGLGTLERAVLAFAAAANIDFPSVGKLLDLLTGSPLNSPMPWYRALDRTLPTDRVAAKITTVSRRLPEVMQEAGTQCMALLSQVVPEDHYNERLAATRNKAAVLVEQVLRLICRGLKYADDGPVGIVVDRLGGRANYQQLLMDTWPERQLFELEGTDQVSRYRLAGQPADWWFEFLVDADQHRLPVALASMVSKYVRELLMDEFNSWWSKQVPGLRPTAGYYGDARRFLRDIQPHVPATGLAPAVFVRER